jgi:hypothetical protein
MLKKLISSALYIKKINQWSGNSTFAFFQFKNSFLTEFLYCAILEVLIPKMQEKWN